MRTSFNIKYDYYDPYNYDKYFINLNKIRPAIPRVHILLKI